MDRPRTLLLGLGNDILTDDAVGLLVVRRLGEELAGVPGLDIRETQEMGLALLDYLVGYEEAVLVDAVQTAGGAPPGTLHEVDAASLVSLVGRTPHFLGVGETLQLGRELGLDMPRRVRIFAIEAADVQTLGTSLTPALKAALPAILARIRAALAER